LEVTDGRAQSLDERTIRRWEVELSGGNGVGEGVGELLLMIMVGLAGKCGGWVNALYRATGR